MLFAHGYGCDQNMWRFVAPAFEASHRTILFDHVGAGKSDLTQFLPEKYARLDGYAEDIVDICEELGLRDVVFVGHSVSAMIGVLASIQRPDLFSRLVLVGPSARYVNDVGYTGGFERQDIDGLLAQLDSNHLGWSRAMAPAIMANPDRPALAGELTESFCRTNPEMAKHFARATFLADNRDDLPRVTVPSLVLQCSDDIIAPDVVGRYVHDHLINSRFVKLKATGHCPNLSAPEETVAAIKNYLRETGLDA
jgi:sigma-B regulation protein RsbQ